MTSTDELLCCPFCGGVAMTLLNGHVIDMRYSVGCQDDECRGFIGLSWLYKTEVEAIAAWNTRAELTCEFNVVEEYIPGKRQRANICKCSNCGYQCAYGFIVDERFKYCPNCGAKVTP